MCATRLWRRSQSNSERVTPVKTHLRGFKPRALAATLLAMTMVSTGTAYGATVAISRTTGGHAANVDASDYRYHIYACDQLDDGHQIEGQARMATGETRYVRDSAGGSCSHLDGNTIINSFRACRLEITDTCGPWVAPKRTF